MGSMKGLQQGRRLLVMAMLASAALMQPATAATITDGSGRQVEVTDTSRTVAAGGSVTEILYALGLQDRIVAVDTTSLYPAAALAEHPNVGYLRALSSEGLLSVKPTLILAEADAGPKDVVGQLQNASVPFVTVPDEASPEGIAEKIRFVGKVMGKPSEGEHLAATLLADFRSLEEQLAKVNDRPKVLFILSTAGDRMMAAGAGTSADEMIKLAKAENALTDFAGYKQVNGEAIIAAAPDVILMMTRSGAHAPGEALFANPAIAQTPAGRNKRLITMDGLYLLGFGPRTAHAAATLAAKLHPDAAIAPLPERPWTK
ncbi:heme/hemin ABC transporter substrate-binding protein [Rhodoligotrophos defluvii]|uniref:heme/hemin ABC transporter substrate-binding protein n=1 Tax=Rhodoligotrophos defluvii TaxID=2561934 RepID=UPI0010CA12BF|nr:ABC transporter substrate-binding protein [Rhodoligotrophos defluvii]